MSCRCSIFSLKFQLLIKWERDDETRLAVAPSKILGTHQNVKLPKVETKIAFFLCLLSKAYFHGQRRSAVFVLDSSLSNLDCWIVYGLYLSSELQTSVSLNALLQEFMSNLPAMILYERVQWTLNGNEEPHATYHSCVINKSWKKCNNI